MLEGKHIHRKFKFEFVGNDALRSASRDQAKLLALCVLDGEDGGTTDLCGEINARDY